jgi:rSAM/selenodomain-associated transferase 2
VVASTTADRATLAVIVPTLDEAGNLPRLFASLAGADAPEQLIVVDGGSTDGTPEVASAGGATVLSAPRGRGAQLQAGGRAATADLLLFLHADTHVGPGALAALRAAFADPRVIATGMRQRIAADGRFYRLVAGAADRRVRRGRVYGDSGLCVRRADYEAVGGFRPLPIFEDLDLSKRLRARGRIALVAGAELTISPRRWKGEGALRRTLWNWILTFAWKAGVDPARLVRHYPAHRAARASGAADPREANPT